MNETLLPLIAGVITGSLGFAAWYATKKRRRAEATRRVEAPNSHYSSRGVRERDDKERWQRIDLGHLHPINRDEVRRLLAVVDVSGAGALSPKERTFLENMTRPRRKS
jgi:hypothetical protein